MGNNNLQHITQNSQEAAKPHLGIMKSFFHKPWYIVYPACLVVTFATVAIVVYAIILLDIVTTRPLTLVPDAPSYSTYFDISNKYTTPEPVTLISLWSAAPWIEARNLKAIEMYYQNADDIPSFWSAKKKQWRTVKWSLGCTRANGKIVGEGTMGGPVYYCVIGSYADGGKECKENSECTSNRCVRYFSSDEIQIGAPRHCATYENWDGPERSNYKRN